MDFEELIKENQRLKEKLESCWQDIADSVRDATEYQATIFALREEIKTLNYAIQSYEKPKENE